MNISPILIEEYLISVRKNKPIITIATPIMFPKFGFVLMITNCTKGIKTMFIPVIKADFEAVVYFNPIVCDKNPMKRNTPSIKPCLKPSNLIFFTCLPKKMKKNKIVRRNLEKTSALGETSLSTIFIKGKVRPQKIETENNIASGLYSFKEFMNV